MKNSLTTAILAAALAVGTAFSVQASIIIDASRVVYPAEARDVTLRVANPDKEPVLVQAWLGQRSNSAPDGPEVPFALSPAVGRVDANGAQSIRIVALPNALPRDRESIFYLHVIGIPAKPADGSLSFVQVALRNVIKVFYRPQGLPGDANRAHAQLKWAVQGTDAAAVLHARNDSPYYVSFANFSADVGGKALKDIGGGMVAPFSTTTFVVPTLAPHLAKTGATLRYATIDDWGAINEAPLILAP
jgi:P pilus assembly chaperone PapD